MSSKRERRYTPAKELRVQPNADGTKTISGYAAVYSSRSVDLGQFTEIIAPGAFRETLRNNKDVLCLRDHDQTILLGRTTSGTLTLEEDANGLRFSCQLPNTTQAADLAKSIRRGDLSGVSFGFQVVDDKWSSDGSGNVLRTLLAVNLLEISPCSFAAYPASEVSIRSCPPELRNSLRSAEDDKECECDCPECLEGNCDDCSDEDCDCEGCTCSQIAERSVAPLNDSLRNRMHMRLALALRK